MALQFSTLLALDLLIAIPVLGYYYYWGVAKVAKEKGAHISEIMGHIKKAYILTGVATIYIPLLLLYYLYANLLNKFPEIFIQTSLIMISLIAVFEYVNYYSFVHFEGARVKYGRKFL